MSTPEFPESAFAPESASNLRTAGAQQGEGGLQLTKLLQSLLETLQDTRRRIRHLYSQASCNMSNWDYWRGTFEAAQAQAQVAASQASKFAEVVSAQVRAHMDVSSHSLCSQQDVSRMLDQRGSLQSR